VILVRPLHLPPECMIDGQMKSKPAARQRSELVLGIKTVLPVQAQVESFHLTMVRNQCGRDSISLAVVSFESSPIDRSVT